MPNRDWLPGFAIVLILIFAIYVSGGLGYQQGKRDGAYGSARQDYQDSVDLAPLGGDIEAQKTDPKAYREEWRSQQDLYAQRDMAEWAWWMMVFTGAGLIVTTAGLVYIALTLNATRDGNQINREIGETQARAYLSVIGGEVTMDRALPLYFSITFLIHNSGNSPARDIEVSVEACFEDRSEVGGIYRAKVGMLLVNEVGSQISYPREFVIQNFDIGKLDPLLTNRGNIGIHGTMSYRHVFLRDDDPKETATIALSGYIDEKRSAWTRDSVTAKLNTCRHDRWENQEA